MNIYSENINQLAELQALDNQILKLEKELAAFPREIEALNDKTESAREELNEASQKLKAALVEKKDLENAIFEADENIKKHQLELNAVKSNEAFKALLSEIENLKKRKDENETRVLEFMDLIDSLSSAEKTAAAEFRKLEEECRRKEAEIEEMAEAVKAQVSAMKTQRQSAAAKIDEELLTKYENIREHKGGLALAEIKTDGKNYFCGGCNISLTPDQRVNSHKKDVMVVCENCGRLMRLKPGTGEKY